jgi:hypothetical protein
MTMATSDPGVPTPEPVPPVIMPPQPADTPPVVPPGEDGLPAPAPIKLPGQPGAPERVQG